MGTPVLVLPTLRRPRHPHRAGHTLKPAAYAHGGREAGLVSILGVILASGLAANRRNAPPARSRFGATGRSGP